jgi:hypothetical protein
MTVTSATLVSAAALDAVGRFVGNVGVPAAIAFFILAQITPRLDVIASNQVSSNTNLAVIAATCSGRTLPYVTP